MSGCGGSQNGDIKLIDYGQAACYGQAGGHEDYVTQVDFNPHKPAEMVSLDYAGAIRVWRIHPMDAASRRQDADGDAGGDADADPSPTHELVRTVKNTDLVCVPRRRQVRCASFCARAPPPPGRVQPHRSHAVPGSCARPASWPARRRAASTRSR